MAMKQLQHIAGTLLFINSVKFGRNIKTTPLHRGVFASFLSIGFTTMAVINPPERRLAKRTSVHWFVE